MLTFKFYIYAGLLLLINLFGLINWSKLPVKYRLLVVIVSIVLVSETTTRVIAHIYGTSNPVYHFFIPIHLFLFALYYNKAFTPKVVVWIGIGFSSVCILLSLIQNSLFVFPTTAFLILAFYLILFSLIDMTRILKTSLNQKLKTVPEFWINTGNILFYTLTFFVFGLNNIGINVIPAWVYDLIFITNIVLYSAYGISLYYAKSLKS